MLSNEQFSKLAVVGTGLMLLFPIVGYFSLMQRSAANNSIFVSKRSPVLPGHATVPQLRTYTIECKRVLWDFGNGQQAYKLVFALPNATFSPLKDSNGILQCVMRANENDHLHVTLINNCPVHVSLHPHGLLYTQENEGRFYPTEDRPTPNPGDKVAPGESFTYEWTVAHRSVPLPGSPYGSVFWPIHSSVAKGVDVNTGLIAGIIVNRFGSGDDDALPLDVDHDQVILMHIFEEENSHLFRQNNIEFFGNVSLPSDYTRLQAAHDHGLHVHHINGRAALSLPPPVLVAGKRTRFYLVSLGDANDWHTFHFHGHTVVDYMGGGRSDTIGVGPGAVKVVDMIPDNPGTWILHCHVTHHEVLGMKILYRVVSEMTTKET